MATITGTAANDTLTGTSGDDVLQGLGGNDVLRDELGGNDTLDGGDGDDELTILRAASYYANSPTVTLNGGIVDSLFGSDGADIFLTIAGTAKIDGATGWTPSPSWMRRKV